jgi:hypothetical protein
MMPDIRTSYVAALCALVALICAGSASAATTFAPNRFDDPASGGTDCAPPAPPDGCSLRGAVEAAQNGDTIQLAAGTYVLSRGELRLTHEVTIAGAGPQATTIEQSSAAGSEDRVIRVELGVGLAMSGVTITAGDVVGADGGAGGQGGGVSGGGIEAGGTLTLTEAVVTRNRVVGGSGGAGAPGSGATPGGMGGAGGNASAAGIAGGSPLTLTDVAITDNVAQPGRGGEGGEGGTNGAGGTGGASGQSVGAGVDLGGGTVLSATDTLIAGNQADGSIGGDGGRGGSTTGGPGVGGQGEPSDGGAIFSNGLVELTNVTIAGNTSGGAFGGAGGAARGSSTQPGAEGGVGFGGFGGGVALFNSGAGEFASVTIAANVATGGAGGEGGAGANGGATGAGGFTFPAVGGDVYLTDATLTIGDSILASGQAGVEHQNCSLGGGGVLTSTGHNLDDTDQCIAKPSTGDLLDTPAGLAPLANNGGPTETMALLAGSAAIRAGASPCLSAGLEPLKTDQRGLPRGEPCDIGAFEGQAPSVTATPKVTGSPFAGRTVTCAATYGGDVPQTLAVQWLRDGTPIAGASGASYTVLSADPGHALSCRETVANAFGSLTATSAAVTALVDLEIPPLPRARLSLKLSSRKVRDRHTATITLTLGGRGTTVRFSLHRRVGGLRAGKLCVARSRKHKHGRSCLRLVSTGGAPKALTLKLGTTKVRWKPLHLAPGSYELTATPAGGVAVSVTFRVLA